MVSRSAIDDDLYRIGTVATLTGISVERLRAWERRYGLAPAHRSGKTRFYSRQQLDTLERIKRLIDQGHPISSLAALSDEQLDERLSAATPRLQALQSATVGLIGPNLLVLEQQQGSDNRLEIRARWANMDAFMSDQTGTERIDVIVAQLPVLLVDHVNNLARFHPESRIVAIYQFATPAQITAVQELGIPTLTWPAGWQEIEHACATTAGLPLRAARTAVRRFSDEELIAISASEHGDPAACPQHLVELISGLNAFAEYTLSCADEAAEPEMYQRVHTDTTQARAQLELALEMLVDPDAG
ncbi:MAG: MerR family transcriptional regulator [Pseudomonadales bacterium]|nr:MerR family transcriptional regulator [Pseudomonadales bacterium]NIX09586.1 MerR family transcriptional regulator [Pseudomonadales bacterium]